MPLPTPTLTRVHGVLGLRDVVVPDSARDETFIAAVRSEFANVLGRAALPPESDPSAPHMTLASTSSQLAVSRIQADFEVRFYGDYLEDIGRGLEYVERKLASVVSGFEAIGAAVSTIGLIGTLHFSYAGRQERPVDHILQTHLRTAVDPSEVQDAVARVAVRLRDTYFVNLTLSNYETRTLERPLMPGLLRIRGWEGRVEDHGLELVLDINNNLEGRTLGRDPEVTHEAVRAVTRLLRDVATDSGPTFAETGEVSVERLTESSLA